MNMLLLFTTYIEKRLGDERRMKKLILRMCSYLKYYHLRSTMKREHFFAKVYFSNVDGFDSNLSRFTNFFFRFQREIDNVYGAIRSCFVRVK